MQRPDEELLARGAAGDEAAFRELVERWERPVFAFLQRMLGTREEAQDLTQETFLRVYRAADRCQPSGQFRSWLFRIAGNLARSRLRRRALVRWLPFELGRMEPASPEPDAQRALETEEASGELRHAIARLPDRQRQALVLKQYEEMSYREIAETMGTTTGSVQMLLHRAMTALRTDLGRRRGES